MAVFVLISGAWHGAWCWERLVPELQARGHVAVAPDLLGMGADRTPMAGLTLARWADQVAEVVRAQAAPVVLVGHSRGGVVISETAERAPERIGRLVYLAAMLVPDGGSMAAVSGPERIKASEGLLGREPDGTSTVPAEMVGAMFYNSTPAAWVERAVAQVGPEPMGMFDTPLRLSAERFGRVPRAYIECLEDRAIPLEMQRAMQAALPCRPVVSLATDHSPFYSAPEALAEALSAIALA